MKRLIVLVMVLGLIFGSIGVADAGKKKRKKPAPKKIERVVEFEYLCPCIGQYQFGGATGENLGGGVFAVGDESFLTAEATDTAGMPVPVDIQQDTDGDGFNNPVGSFCGKTETPMSINPGLEIRVFVGGPTACSAPSLVVGGTITFTLSNLP